MSVHSVQRLKLTVRLVNVVAIVGVGAATVWFGFAAADASGAQMAAASATFAAFASGWAGAFAAVTSKLRSGEATQA
ncbi:hypothetical protein FVO59_11035 [Microbacterium esteraromaticum]|uniref:Uncharacterized protein n=1 Tax=Microbacterium esteraromaticum TaxID=57043 RepID=A0A7D7WGN5_9MICO|nr:hypothetical protein [Microbacterium esteraromaticum]QMU97691.1 hypothetical protein FVO59_11035 [Microbacterium esteraromaticum]